MERHRRSNPFVKRCITTCPSAAPQCNCGTGFDCVITSQTCDACAVAQCVASSSGSSSGVGKGALAGAVVGVLAFLFLVVGGFLYYRRRANARKATTTNREKAAENAPGNGTAYPPPVPDGFTPQGVDGGEKPPSHHSQEPGTIRVYTNSTNSTINLDPESYHGDPFTDNASIGTGTTNSMHVIPIAFVSPGEGGRSPYADTFSNAPTSPGAPSRPHRSPDLTLNHGADFFGRPTSILQPPRPGYAPSQRSGFTMSSIGSNASSTLEAILESPTIVSAGTRQVLGAVRAEVVQVPAGGLSAPQTPAPTLRPSTLGRRSTHGSSPLASSSLANEFPLPADPFADHSRDSMISHRSDMTFGTPLHSSYASQSPRPKHDTVATLGGSLVADISSGRRVFLQPNTSSDGSGASQSLEHPLSSHGRSMPSPTNSQNEAGSQEVYVQYYNPVRGSQSSFVSASSRTDSVLAGFPFVPPSPLPSTNRSPLSVVFNNRQSTASSASTEMPTLPPLPSPRRAQTFSTISHASSASSGLDGFQFHFGGSAEEPVPPLDPALMNRSGPPSSSLNRPNHDRASLDTLALSRDLVASQMPYEDPDGSFVSRR